MDSFVIQIAGCHFSVKTVHTRTKALCRDFIISEKDNGLSIDASLEVTEAEILAAKNDLLFEGKVNVDYWDGSVEVTLVLRKICEELIEHDTLMFHGAAIELDGNAYIFSGPSGIGKTTHINLWRKMCPETRIINGDKPFIIARDQPKVCGSPWAGKEIQYTNSIFPLKAIIMLERSEKNQIWQVPFQQAFLPLLEQTYCISDRRKMVKTIKLLQNLQRHITFWHFQVNNFADDCFKTAYEALIRPEG